MTSSYQSWNITHDRSMGEIPGPSYSHVVIIRRKIHYHDSTYRHEIIVSFRDANGWVKSNSYEVLDFYSYRERLRDIRSLNQRITIYHSNYRASGTRRVPFPRIKHLATSLWQLETFRLVKNTRYLVRTDYTSLRDAVGAICASPTSSHVELFARNGWSFVVECDIDEIMLVYLAKSELFS